MRSRSPQSLTAFGERKTLIEWTRDPQCQVSLRELRSRVERGWGPEEAITTPSAQRPSRARNSLAAFGEEKSISEWARDERAAVAGLTIAARIQRGWDPEEAITTPVHGKVRPVRASVPRPPHTRRPRLAVSNEPVSDLDAQAVCERLITGAELWFAGSSGDRVTLVERDSTTLIAAAVLSELEEAGRVVAICKVGSVVQYGLAQPVLSR